MDQQEFLEGPGLAPALRRAAFVDPDELGAALQDVEVDYLRLAPGRFTAMLTALDLGPVRLQFAVDDAHISRGHVAPDISLLLFGMQLPQDRTLVNGLTIGPSDLLHLGPGAPLFARVQGPVRWSSISFHADTLRNAVAAERQPQAEQFLIRRDARGHAALAALSREAGDMISFAPDRLGFRAVRRSLVEDVLRLAAAAAQDAPQVDAAIRAIHRRVRLVADAEDFLAAHLGEPLYSEDLQQALRVPMRTLHNAFVAVHGMSVHRYLRLRRLHLARAALRAGNGSPAQVKIAALTHGFWHLGRFAQDYRALFGELPSETCVAGRPAFASRS